MTGWSERHWQCHCLTHIEINKGILYQPQAIMFQTIGDQSKTT